MPKFTKRRRRQAPKDGGHKTAMDEWNTCAYGGK